MTPPSLPSSARDRPGDGLPLTEYELYLRTDELLGLQKSDAELSCDDELAFQVVQQVEELWMKLALRELHRAMALVDEDRLTEANRLFGRINQLAKLMGEQMAVLESLSPRSFHTIRKALGRGSGQESPGFNAILAAGDPLRSAVGRVLGRHDVELLDVHRDPSLHPRIFALTAVDGPRNPVHELRLGALPAGKTARLTPRGKGAVGGKRRRRRDVPHVVCRSRFCARFRKRTRVSPSRP